MGKDDEDPDEDHGKKEVLQKMHKARQNIIQEIICTQESYVKDLKSIVDVFFQPEDETKFQEAKIDVYLLFSNFKEIYETENNFLELLYKQVKHVDFDDQHVGQCFLEMSEELKDVYSEYCATSDSSMTYLQKVKENPVLIQKLNEVMLIHGDTNKSVSIMSMLMKPVQRITKYPLLLAELLKATEESHVDHAHLVEAKEAIQKVVNAVNESKRTRELVMKYRKKSDNTLWDKFSHINRHSFQKKLTRACGYIAVNSGLYTEIKDELFESKLNEFMSTQKAVEVLCDNLHNYVQAFEETMTTFCDLSSHIKELYGDSAFGSLFVNSLLELSRLVSTTISPSVKTVVQSAVINPLSTLIKLYEGPVALINKRWDKLMEVQGDDKNDLTKKEYEALNNQLIKELPMLTKMSQEVVLNCIIVFNFVKEMYLNEWRKHLEDVLMHMGSEKETNDREQQVKAILSSLRFNEFLDANYPIGLLANVLMNVPVINPVGGIGGIGGGVVDSTGNKFTNRSSLRNSLPPLRHSMPPLRKNSLPTKEKERVIKTISHSASFSVSDSLRCVPENSNMSDISDTSRPTSQASICSILITPPTSMDNHDDGFYYAKCPYYARMNQYEVSLYDGQFVTVLDKKDGNNNHDWWQVFTDDQHYGYCPAICLEKASDFMETARLPELTELQKYNNDGLR